MQYLSTSDIDDRDLHSSVRLFRILLAMATPVRKPFTTNVEQMQRRRHHMTASGLLVFLCKPTLKNTNLKKNFRQLS